MTSPLIGYVVRMNRGPIGSPARSLANLEFHRGGNRVNDVGHRIVAALEADAEGRALDFNPCLTCKLCVAACPVGAIGADGRFDFSACYTHNYQELMGGFTDWVETVADSRAWLDVLGRRRGLLPALLRGKVRFRGSPRLLRTFAACFAAA